MAILNGKTGFTNILFRIIPNPTIRLKTESGIILNRDMVKSEETGDFESVTDQIIGFGEIIFAGPECKYVKTGDYIFFDRRSIRPVPLGAETWQISEQNMVTYVERDDETLKQAFEEFNAEQKQREEEERRARLSQKLTL